MKMLLLLLAVGLAAAGRLENTYLPPSSASSAGGQDLALPVVRTHTEAVVAPPAPPSNEYLPPASSTSGASAVVVSEARLQQRPQPLGGSGILRQQGLQSTLGSGAPAPLLPQAQSQQSSFSSQQSYSFGPTVSSFGLLSKTSPYQQQSSLPKASAFQQQSSFAQQASIAKTPSFSFGSQQTSLPLRTVSAQTSSSFGSQQQASSSSAGLRQGGFFSSAQQQPIAILRSVNINNGDGSYTYSYQTENGIEAQEQGEFRPDARAGAEGGALTAQGGFAFTAPDNNQRYTLTYTADENGFRAFGEHLPTPPPVPEAILRSIEFNAREEAAQQQQGYRYQQQGYQQQQGSQQGYQYQQPQVVNQRQSYQQQQGSQQGYRYQQPQVIQRQSYQPFQQATTQQPPASNGGYRY